MTGCYNTHALAAYERSCERAEADASREAEEWLDEHAMFVFGLEPAWDDVRPVFSLPWRQGMPASVAAALLSKLAGVARACQYGEIAEAIEGDPMGYVNDLKPGETIPASKLADLLNGIWHDYAPVRPDGDPDYVASLTSREKATVANAWGK